MSAEVLREAARLMRERALGVEPSATAGCDWWSYQPDLNPRAVIRADVDDAICSTPAIAQHVASWSPGVAVAVAGWLDACALVEESAPTRTKANALAVARAYLGDTA